MRLLNTSFKHPQPGGVPHWIALTVHFTVLATLDASEITSLMPARPSDLRIVEADTKGLPSHTRQHRTCEQMLHVTKLIRSANRDDAADAPSSGGGPTVPTSHARPSSSGAAAWDVRSSSPDCSNRTS